MGSAHPGRHCPARRRPPRRCAAASWPPPPPVPRRDRRRTPSAAPRRRRAARRTRGRVRRRRSGRSTASVSIISPAASADSWLGAGEPVGALAGHGVARVRQQPYGEAPLQHVHQDGRGARHRPLEGRVRARAPVGDAAGCPAAPCSGPAAAAPRGAPSARRSGRWSASARGAGRRRGGSRAGSRRPRRPAPASGCRAVAVPGGLTGQPHRRQRLRRAGSTVRVSYVREGAGQLAHAERVGQPQLQRAQRIAARAGRSGPGRTPRGARPPPPGPGRTGAADRARTAPGPGASAGPWAAARRCPSADGRGPPTPAGTRAGESRRLPATR